jgi:CysZ protein
VSRPGLVGGALRVRSALGLLRRERSLWPYCALPFALNLLLFGTALAVFTSYYPTLTDSISSVLTLSDPEAWYEWLWVGPVRALAWLVRWLLIAVVAFIVYLLFTVVGSVIAAPFLEILSQRVERLCTGQVVEAKAGMARASLRAVVEDAKRTCFFLAGQLLILFLGLVPGLQPVAALGALLFTALFLPLDYTSYLLDRRGVRFRSKRAWLWQNRRPMLGFGLAGLVTFLIPGLNFVCLPLLVTAGTTLALELPPPD